MENNINENIINSLEDITRLLAILVKRGIENQSQIINEMDSVGFSPKRIAELLNTSPNSVRVSKHLSKKKK